MRAKLKITAVHSFEGMDRLEMTAVCRSDSYPEDGSDEDNTYAKFSPTAKFEISIQNPALLGKFAVGEKYYVDFTKADA